MAVQIIDPIDDKRWLDFVIANKAANIFHHPAWLKVLKTQYRYLVFAICCINENNEITAGIPFCEVSAVNFKKKWVSLPFSDYSYPLYCKPGQVEEIIQSLSCEHRKGKLNSVEIYWEIDSGQGFEVNSTHVFHITELNKDENSLLKSFHRTKSQGIAKSIKQGLTANFSTDEKSVETFYNLHLKTRKKLGVPIQPRRFFRHVYEEIIKTGLGFVVTVEKDNIPLAAGLFMGFNETLTYKYNASDPDYLEYRPNNLIIWAAMQEGIKKGFRYFDFGKSAIANEGLRSFKDGWAAVEKPLYHSYFPTLPPEGISFSFIKDKLLSPVIKSSPDFVCKIIGEVAYKYFPSL